MRPTIKVIAILTGFLVFSPSSFAGDSDGNTLLEECAVVEKGMDTGEVVDQLHFGHCTGLVQGVSATMDTFVRGKVCFPESGFTAGQGTRIVLAYLRKNPAQLHENGIALIMKAFFEAYPCK